MQSGGYIGSNIHKRVEKTLTEMVLTKSMLELKGFNQGVLLVMWVIDKEQGWTKLGYHFGCYIRPGAVANLLYMYEDDESLENMEK